MNDASERKKVRFTATWQGKTYDLGERFVEDGGWHQLVVTPTATYVDGEKVQP